MYIYTTTENFNLTDNFLNQFYLKILSDIVEVIVMDFYLHQ